MDVLLKLHQQAVGNLAAAQQVADGFCTAAGMIMTVSGPIRCARLPALQCQAGLGRTALQQLVCSETQWERCSTAQLSGSIWAAQQGAGGSACLPPDASLHAGSASTWRL